MSDPPPSDHDPSLSPSASAAAAKLRKIPPIPIRRDSKHIANAGDSEADQDPDDRHHHEDPHDDADDRGDQSGDSSILMASSLGLNHIRTRSAPLPLRTSAVGTPSNLGDNSRNNTSVGVESEPKPSFTEQGMYLCIFFSGLCFG